MTLQDELERLKNIDPPKVVVSQQILVQPKQPKGRGGAPGGGLGGMDDGGYPGGGYPSGPGGAGYPGGDEGGLGGGGLGPGGMGGLGPDDGYPGGGYPGGAGGYPGGGLGVAARPQPAEVLASRRILNSMLEALLLGLAGELDAMKPPKTLAANAKAEAKECADELLAALRTTVDECNNATYDTRPKFLAMLEEQVGELDDWLAQYKPEEEPVEAEAAEPADEPKADDAGVASNP